MMQAHWLYRDMMDLHTRVQKGVAEKPEDQEAQLPALALPQKGSMSKGTSPQELGPFVFFKSHLINDRRE